VRRPSGRRAGLAHRAVRPGRRQDRGAAGAHRFPAPGPRRSPPSRRARSPGAVHGTDVYTDDSSICTAAVHAGAISLKRGGEATITVVGPSAGYVGSVRNGVTSYDWDAPWDWSFEVVTDSRPRPPRADIISWSQTATEFNDRIGERMEFECSAGGRLGSIWGTGRYTDDSSICTAAVHAGRISSDEGGVVSIIITNGSTQFKGTTRNGVTSGDWGQWPSSFDVVD
jgi:LCCL domain